MIVFYSTCLISVLLCFIGEKKSNVKFVILAALSLAFISGYRDYSVGTDTIRYCQYFNCILNGQEGLFEVGFEWIVKAIYGLFGDLRYVFVFLSLVTNLLLFLRLWDFKNTCSFGFMSLVYVCIFFPQTMNIIRQFLALSILFYFSRFISKKNFLFILAVGVATLIHTSSIIMFLILIWHYIIFNKLSKKKILTLIIMSLTMIFLTGKILSIFKLEYSGYLSNKYTGLSVISLMRLLLCISYFYLLNKPYKNIFNLENANQLTYHCFCKFITFTYFVGIILCIVFSSYDQLVRIGSFFIVFELPFVGLCVKNNKYRKIYFITYLLLCFYYLIIKVSLNGECGINNFKLDLG